MTDAAEPGGFSLRRSIVTFVLLAGAVVLVSVALLLVLDPRTQAFWAARWDDVSAFGRSIISR